MRLPQLDRVDIEIQSLLLGQFKTLRDAQIIRPHSQQSRHQGPVRTMAPAGFRKGTI